jgi:hypothetical protein
MKLLRVAGADDTLPIPASISLVFGRGIAVLESARVSVAILPRRSGVLEAMFCSGELLSSASAASPSATPVAKMTELAITEARRCIVSPKERRTLDDDSY